MSLWIITVNFGDTQATKVLIESLSIINNFDCIKVGIADNAASNLSSDQLEKIVSETNLEVNIFSHKIVKISELVILDNHPGAFKNI